MHRIEAMQIEKEENQKALDAGFYSEESLPDGLKENFFSMEEEENLKTYTSKLKDRKKLLKMRLEGSSKYLEDLEIIQDLDQKAKFLQRKKSTVSQFTAEAHAREEAYFYLMHKNVYHTDYTRVWDDINTMLKEESAFLYGLMIEFLDFYWGPDLAVIRRIARCGQWRNMYIGSTKVGLPLFTGTAVDLTMSQQQLLSWTMQYQGIYDLPPDERPSDDVVEDDERFDDFMENYSKKLKAEALAASSGKSGKALDDQHAIVTASSNKYVDLHKAEAYSDTSLITGRVNEEGKVYSEAEEVRDIRRKKQQANRAKKPKNRLNRR